MLRMVPLLLFLPPLLSLVTTAAEAYQAGDPIGLLLRTSEGTRDALRSQMPSFAVDTNVILSVDIDPSRDESSNNAKLSMALTFGTGAESKSLPWVDVSDPAASAGGRMLTTLQVTFVYASGGIRSVSQSATFGPLVKSGSGRNNQKIAVKYIWIEEASIDLDSGLWGMFVSVLVASLILLISACGSMGSSDDDGGGDHSGYASDSTYGSSYNSGPSAANTAGSWAGAGGGVPAATAGGKWQ